MRPSPRPSAAASPRRRRRRRRSPRRRRRRRRRMRLFDRRVARSAPSERARDARRGGDAGECVQMRDGVLTMHTRRARPRHRRDARRARAPAEPPTDRHRRRVVVSRSRAKRNAMPSQRFALGVSTARVSRKANIGCVSRSNGRLRSAILSIRRGGADQRAAGFFLLAEFEKCRVRVGARDGCFPSHPRNPARDSSHERSFPVNKRGV